jgi:hypothetical protein
MAPGIHAFRVMHDPAAFVLTSEAEEAIPAAPY